jgi:putative tricarboxylic transport membrane protein
LGLTTVQEIFPTWPATEDAPGEKDGYRAFFGKIRHVRALSAASVEGAQLNLLDLWHGLSAASSFANIGYALVGCFLGMLVGVLPGLGPASAMAIVLPVAIYLPPAGSIIIMAGIYYGAMYGGSTTAILMNIPGEVSSTVTAIDGFQMTRQGRAGEALAIAAIGSLIAGIVGTLAIGFIGPAVAGLALQFGPAEYFGLVVFSLTALVSFAGRSILLGVAMGFIGIWLATFGTDQLTGVQRLSFGNMEMMKGIDIIPLTVGLFGIGEVMFSAGQKISAIFEGKLPPWYRMLPRGQQMVRGLTASLRGTFVGGVMGLLPGMVPALTTYLAYDVEKKFSRHGHELGSGAIEGVAAPEAANNATAMFGFIPLLSLGIPTSPALAMVLGTLIMNGLQPGPELFKQHPDFAFTVIASMLISNAMLFVMSLPLIGFWARISKVPYSVLGTIVLTICIIGAYAPRNSMFDVYIAIGFGIMGYLMRRLDWPMSPLILGFLMGPLLEQSMRQALSISSGNPAIFVSRPIAVICLVAAALVLLISIVIRVRSSAAAQFMAEGANEV